MTKELEELACKIIASGVDIGNPFEIGESVFNDKFKKAEKEAVKQIESLLNTAIERARVEEIELAESKNVPAGGLHRPSYYAIDPDYAEKRLATLKHRSEK